MNISNLFKKPYTIRSEKFGDLKYNAKLQQSLGFKSDVSITISNIDEQKLNQDLKNIENLYDSLIERAEDYTKERIVKLQKNENIKVSKLEIIAINFTYANTNISTELTFKETGSSELGDHWVITSIDKNLDLEDNYGIEG